MSVLQATIQHTFLGQAVDNCVGVDFPTNDLDSSDCHFVAGVIHGYWAAGVLPQLHNELHLVKTSVIEAGDTTTGSDYTGSASGGISGALLPSFCAARVKFTTAYRGRSYRGRTGLAGITEDMTDSLTPNNLKDANRSTLAGVIAEWLDNCNNDLGGYLDGGFLAVVSTIHMGAPRVPAIATKIIGSTVTSELGTRRSRF